MLPTHSGHKYTIARHPMLGGLDVSASHRAGWRAGLVDDSSAGLLRQVRWLHGPPMLAVVDRLGNLALLDARGRQQSLRWASVEAGSGGGGSGRSSPRRSLSPARLLRRLSSPQLTRPGSGRRSLSLPRPLRRTASPATMRGNPAFDGFDPALDRCLPAALWAPPARDHPAQRRFSAAAFVLPGEARPGEWHGACCGAWERSVAGEREG